MLEHYFRLIIEEQLLRTDILKKAKQNEDKESDKKDQKIVIMLFSILFLFCSFDYFYTTPAFLNEFKDILTAQSPTTDYLYYYFIRADSLNFLIESFPEHFSLIALKMFLTPLVFIINFYVFLVFLSKEFNIIKIGKIYFGILFLALSILFVFSAVSVDLFIFLYILVSVLGVLLGISISAVIFFTIFDIFVKKFKKNELNHDEKALFMDLNNILKEKEKALSELLKSENAIQEATELRFDKTKLLALNEKMENNKFLINNNDLDFVFSKLNNQFDYKEYVKFSVNQHFNINKIENS